MASENNNIESDKDGTDEASVKLAATDCCYGASEEIRYRRIGNERRIPFAFWPSSQKCLHRTLLIVLYRSKPLLWKKQGLRRSSFIHAKFDNMTSLLLTQRESSFRFSPSPWDTGLLLMPNRIPLNRIRSSYSLPVSKKTSQFSRERLQCSGWFGMA